MGYLLLINAGTINRATCSINRHSTVEGSIYRTPSEGAQGANMQDLLVICDNLIKIYKVDDLEVVALQGLDLEVARGEMIAIVGASGSGKSTLLNILGGLDTPSAGRAIVAGHDLTRLSEQQRTRYRSLIVGHVWQQSGRNLLADLTIADNVDLPQILKGVGRSGYRRRTSELLEIVGLADMAKKRPAQLSG